MSRVKRYKHYEDFLVDISEYFAELNFASYLKSLTPGEVSKDRKRISLLISQEVTQENIKQIAEERRNKASAMYESIIPRLRSSRTMPPIRIMDDFGFSELEMLIILYLSWQEVMTDQVYLYTRTITHLLKMLIGNDREAMSKLKHFGSNSTIMQSGLVYLDRHNNSPIGASDIIVVDELQEVLMNMTEYDAGKMRKRRLRDAGKSVAQSNGSELCDPVGVKLILPDDTMGQLKLVETYINNKDKIMREWGFGDSIAYGSAMALLFHGPPGTGKTLSARYIAEKTGKQLLIADYAEVMNKYVGETEKKIKGLFAKATSNDAILLIDEVDSLMYGRKEESRSWEVSHVNTMLQAIEGFDGVVVFTTNRADLLDKALDRRILIKVAFRTPDEPQRELIWRSLFSLESSIGHDVDFAYLAKTFPFSGGHIKNAVLMAGLNAVERGHDAIMHKDLLDAARTEMTKVRVKERMGFVNTPVLDGGK